ncbi:MAG TPA: hypothetical protein VG844_01895 [Terracidiphilus sp.]|nr:hypothetical protein [Terracidiphilus sp.]
MDPAVLEGSSGSRLAHNAMTEEALLGENGWAVRFYPRVREDLYLMLDDGWEKGGTATFELDPVKFPSYKGDSTQRLRALNQKISGHGWRGTALWCRNTPGGAADLPLEKQSDAADIRYWKIDIGDPDFNLIRTRNQEKFALTLEHVHGEPPTNGDWKTDGRFGVQPWDSRRMEILRNTDVYRTYDVTSILSLPTTLDRVSEMLKSAAGHPELQSLLNVEDEVYVAAVLGCTMGIMRHPMHGLRPHGDSDLFFNGPRKAKQRIDEVVRALRWQRIAAPYACGHGSFRASAEILRDGWTFSAGETWQHDLLGQTVWQGAPAILARNIDLPEVETTGEKPFVFAARFTNGAVAIGAQERTQPGHAWRMPRARVTLNVGDASGPFGVFGEFEQLTLVFGKSQKGRTALAQDLAADEPVDITSSVEWSGTSIRFKGNLLRKIGLHGRTPGDLSSPGVAIALL